MSQLQQNTGRRQTDVKAGAHTINGFQRMSMGQHKKTEYQGISDTNGICTNLQAYFHEP